jgi:hypothetical protein
MRRLLFVSLVIFISITTAACGPGKLFGPTFTLTPTNTLTPTSTPTLTPTLIPSPTSIPVPEGFNNLPEGFVPIRNENGTWGVGIDQTGQTEAIPNFSVDNTGARLVLNDITVDIPTNEIQDRIKVGQEGVLQIYNEQKTAIDYAYDEENKVWIKASDVLQPDYKNPENYIHLQTWDDLKKLARLQEMILTPFPTDTFSWLSDKVILNYQDSSINRDPTADYAYWRPLGVLEDVSKSPFKIVSYSLLEKGEGISRVVYIITVQVYNTDNGSYSTMQYVIDWLDSDRFISYASSINPDEYFLPALELIPLAPSHRSLYPVVDYLLDHGYLESDGSRPKTKTLVDQWLTNGHVPPELGNIPLYYHVFYFHK